MADHVRDGRLRDLDWPYGLRAVVTAGVVVYVLAVALALASSVVRRVQPLAVPNSVDSSSPAGLVWLLVWLMLIALVLLHTAAVHGPWWMVTLGILTTVLQLGTWGVAIGAIGGRPYGLPLTVGCGAFLVVFSLVRKRRGFVWWEFVVYLAVSAVVVGGGLAAMGSAGRDIGFFFAPVFVAQIVQVLQFVVLPAALAAGAAVAEVAVAVTLVATRQAQRLTRRRWPYAILLVVVVIRLAQSVHQVLTLDPVESGWVAIAPALAVVTAFGLLAWWILRISRTGVAPAVSQLPAELGRVGLPVGVAMVCLQLPLMVFLLAFTIVAFADPGRRLLMGGPITVNLLLERGIDGYRALLGVVLVGLAVRVARRGRVNLALILGCVGVMVLALAMRLLTAYRWPLWLDPDAINLVSTTVVLVMTLSYLVRRQLTATRAVALAGLFVLSALFSSRDFISDPVGAVIGYSGVALVLFGVTWDFLTGSAWANGESRLFPRPTRVLLVLTYAVLTVVVVAYAAVVRSSYAYGGLGDFAELGDLVLGTALLAAAVTAVVSVVRRDGTLT